MNIESARHLQSLLGAQRMHLSGDPECQFSGIGTDSRRIAPGDLFVALQTPRADGHDYIDAALDAGAHAVLGLADRLELRDAPPPGVALLGVHEPVEKVLADLASAWRQHWSGPIVAVTGSSGKTTVRRMIAGLFANSGGTRGNFNNHLGLPISMLEMDPAAWPGVFELGMNAPGEIAALADLLQPDIGVITNAGLAHVGPLGSRAAIRAAKLELAAVAGTLIVDGEDPDLVRDARALADRLLLVGRDPGMDVQLHSQDLLDDGRSRLVVDGIGGRIELVLPFQAGFLIQDALFAVAVGQVLGADLDRIAAGLGAYCPSDLRWEQRSWRGGGRLVLDCYNANPESMRAALEALRAMPGPHLAVLGEMHELGSMHRDAHEQLAAQAAFCQRIFAWGGEGARVLAECSGERGVWFDDMHALARALQEWPGASILVKGSRVNQLERLLDAL